MERPVLSLLTVYLHDSDREEAQRLGADLYHHLTRPREDPLSHGAGIPVAVGVSADRVDLKSADVVVLLPVLGKTSYNLARTPILQQLAAWQKELGSGRVLPVPTSPNWRSVEDRLPGKQLLTELYSPEDPRRRTLDEIVLAVARLLDDDPATPRTAARLGVRLFVSHAKADLAATGAAAKKIHDYVVTDTTGHAFFDAADLRPGESLGEQIDTAVRGAAVIAVRGDAYSSRVWCQRELMRAKLEGVPNLIVEVLRRGEQRSSPYGGNSPSLVWEGDPAPIVSRAMVEWLRVAFFRREAKRIAKAADLTGEVKVLARPPELLDLAQGPLQSGFAQLVLHPDPELSVLERQVLKAARPRLRLVTPTTAFRRLLNRGDGAADVSSPLEGRQVAMSLSDTPDVNGPDGYTAEHVRDATVYVARTLISAGAAIAYGGDFRTNGFTPLLAQLIQTYNQTSPNSGHCLHSYLAAKLGPEDAPDDLPLEMRHLVHSPEVAKDALMPPPSDKERHRDALYYSDMRRVMALHTQARVILGGQTEPRVMDKGPGYVGLYPGVVEEAWRTLEADKPLYVLGGFGGAAALVADLFEGKETPAQLLDVTWKKHTDFAGNAQAINRDPFRKKLGLPGNMRELAKKIRDLARLRLKNDEASRRWNGLSIEENRSLFQSRDPVTLASLVSKGLLSVARQKSAGQLRIELVHGSVTSATQLDAIAIATLDQVPLGGAGAAIDQVMGGRASAERAGGRMLIPLEEAGIDADWLLMVSLGRMDEQTAVTARVERAARVTADQANRQGFQRLGVVTFGGSLRSDTRAIARAMLKGFEDLPRATTIEWFETDGDRFERLRKLLEDERGIELTTRRVVADIAPPPARREPLILEVRLEGDELTATSLLPAGSAVVPIRRTAVTRAQVAEFSVGRGKERRSTPDLATLRKRGAELARMLFGDEAAHILGRCRDAPMVVIHDVPASKLPFEMLSSAEPELRPALESGLSRRLAVAGVRIESHFARPPKKGRLNVLLVVNPTKDLPGAETEAEKVRDILKQKEDVVNLRSLDRDKATRSAVIKALADADVLHFCGHAFFDDPGPIGSGLVLANNEPLIAADLADIQPLPRVAVVNACEAGRVRGQPETEAVAFAEMFLRSGVEAYLGTYWQVSDNAAATFAATVFTQLAIGDTLDQAVQKARKVLLDAKEPDWANYILFGGGDFRLVVP